MTLQDTRRGPYSGRAMTREIDTGRMLAQERHGKKKTRWEWRHQSKLNDMNIGGVTTGLSNHLNKWVGHDRSKKPAVIEDARNLGRFGKSQKFHILVCLKNQKIAKVIIGFKQLY